MENEKVIINQTANFVRTYHSKFSCGRVTPDKEGLKMLAGIYHIAQKYRLQAQENYYRDEYGANCWHNDSEFYRNVNFILAWCDKFSFLITPAGCDAVAPVQEQTAAATKQRKQRERVKFESVFTCIDDATKGKAIEGFRNAANGKIGKALALVVLGAMEAGIMQKPTFSQVCDFMGCHMGSSTAFNNYMKRGKFAPEEIQGAKNCALEWIKK